MAANRRALHLACAATILMLALPFGLSSGMVAVITTTMAAALFAMAFNLLAGQGGMLSFGHAAYFGAGWFATIHLMIAVEAGDVWTPTPMLPLAGGIAGLVLGACVAWFATVRTGMYFAMITFAVAELIYTLAPNFSGLLGGESGLSSMRMPWAGIGFGRPMEVYYLVLGWCALSVGALYLYSRTLFGRLTLAVRDNEARLPFLGFNVHRTKIAIFAVSAFFSGIAGGLMAVATESANYSVFALSSSAAVVLQTFVGGSKLFVGPAIGAIALGLFGHFASDETRLWLFYQGLVFVAVMLFLPNGIASLLDPRFWAAFGDRLTVKFIAARAAGTVLIAGGIVAASEIVAATASGNSIMVGISGSGLAQPITGMAGVLKLVAAFASVGVGVRLFRAKVSDGRAATLQPEAAT